MTKKKASGAGKSQKPKTAKPKATTKKPRKSIRPAKIFLYALGIAALGGGAYLAYDRLKRKPLNAGGETSEDNGESVVTNILPASFTSSVLRKSSVKQNDNFPLRRGSRGSRVMMLQQALASILGSAVMKANGGIDGQFGPGTANALRMAGYADEIDETDFKKITKTTSSDVQIVFNPRDIALKLFRAAWAKNQDGVLTQLKAIKTVSDYVSVNEYYKKQGFISKTIVTDLLDFAFKNNEEAKQLIRDEFTRIGLKSDDSNTWSLQGIRLFRDIITLRSTLVTDAKNNRIPVKRNTILGDELNIENGMTWFRSIDNHILSVPSQDVKYTT